LGDTSRMDGRLLGIPTSPDTLPRGALVVATHVFNSTGFVTHSSTLVRLGLVGLGRTDATVEPHSRQYGDHQFLGPDLPRCFCIRSRFTPRMVLTSTHRLEVATSWVSMAWRELSTRFLMLSTDNYLQWAKSALAVGDKAEARVALSKGLQVFQPDLQPAGAPLGSGMVSGLVN
jgi:hypothetical protein